MAVMAAELVRLNRKSSDNGSTTSSLPKRIRLTPWNITQEVECSPPFHLLYICVFLGGGIKFLFIPSTDSSFQVFILHSRIWWGRTHHSCNQLFAVGRRGNCVSRWYCICTTSFQTDLYMGRPCMSYC
jgi:hypothetical protein